MSHYAVAVFSDDGDFDQLLEKYNECNDREIWCHCESVKWGDFTMSKSSGRLLCGS